MLCWALWTCARSCLPASFGSSPCGYRHSGVQVAGQEQRARAGVTSECVKEDVPPHVCISLVMHQAELEAGWRCACACAC